MRRSLPAAVVLAAALSVAACTGSNSSGGSASTTSGQATATTTGSAASGDDSVAWVDKVCGEIVELGNAQAIAPPDLQDADAGQALKAFDEYVGRNIDVVDDTIADLRGIGRSPIDGGDEALSTLVTGLEALKKGYERTKSKFASIDPNDPQAAQTAMLEAFTGLSQGGEELGRALESIETNPAIADAVEKAPNCQQLNVDTSTTTTTS